MVTGTNGLVTYGGVTEDGFTINAETGVISVTRVLDRELQDHYTITGTVTLPGSTHNKTKQFCMI